MSSDWSEPVESFRIEQALLLAAQQAVAICEATTPGVLPDLTDVVRNVRELDRQASGHHKWLEIVSGELLAVVTAGGSLLLFREIIEGLQEQIADDLTIPGLRAAIAKAKPLDVAPAAEDGGPGKRREPKGMAELALSDRQYSALQVLLERKAFSPDARCKTRIVAEKAEGNYATEQDYKRAVADLNLRGFLESKSGPNGGIWLTEDGRKLAEQLAENRQH